MPSNSPQAGHIDEPFVGDEPYSYASPLADLLAGLRRIDVEPFDPPVEATEPETALEILGVIRETLTDEVSIIERGDSILYQYPRAGDPEGSAIASKVSATIEYHADGHVWVETEYADTPGQEYKTMFWTGWLDEYDEFEAYKMGALVAIRLLGSYTEAGLSAAQALDLGATAGVGYGDNFRWANRRNVDYEAIRKNASGGRKELLERGWEERPLEREVHVARCGDCGRNMQTAESCDPSRVGILIDSDGEEFERLRFGNEDELTIEHMEDLGVDEEQIDAYKETISRNPIEEGDRCHDCGVVTGGLHHDGCDKELCPKCQGQLLSCECDWQAIGRLGLSRQ